MASYGMHFTSKNKKNEAFDFLFIHSSPFPVVSPILSTIFLLIFPSISFSLCPLLPPYRPRHPKPPSHSLPHFLCVNSTNFISRSSGASSSNFGAPVAEPSLCKKTEIELVEGVAVQVGSRAFGIKEFRTQPQSDSYTHHIR